MRKLNYMPFKVRHNVPNKVKICLDFCYDNMYTIGIVNEKGKNYEV